jgi:hypothetical protein
VTAAARRRKRLDDEMRLVIYGIVRKEIAHQRVVATWPADLSVGSPLWNMKRDIERQAVALGAAVDDIYRHHADRRANPDRPDRYPEDI